MKTLALVGCLASALAFAADPKPAAASPEHHEAPGLMAGVAARKVTKEDKKGVQDAMMAVHKGLMSGNLDEAAAACDFPMFMLTDDKEGNAAAVMADMATWKTFMAPLAKTMTENKEGMQKMPPPKSDMFFLTDTMVVVTSKEMMPMGKAKLEARTVDLLVYKGGKWMMKGMMEGGWGDMFKGMLENKPAEMKPAATAPSGAK